MPLVKNRQLSAAALAKKRIQIAVAALKTGKPIPPEGNPFVVHNPTYKHVVTALRAAGIDPVQKREK
jgi:hypothetical protein